MVEMAATHVRMMQKALEQMNIKVHTVITDLTGKSGMAIVEAIIGGERDPEKLSEHCKKRIRSEKFPAIVKSLQGMWKEEHVFELVQELPTLTLRRRPGRRRRGRRAPWGAARSPWRSAGERRGRR